MVGSPSATAKKIRDLVCQEAKPFNGCCCSTAVSKLWRDVLPKEVQMGVSNLSLKDNFDQTVKAADNIFYALNHRQQQEGAAATPLPPEDDFRSAGGDIVAAIRQGANVGRGKAVTTRPREYPAGGQGRGQSQGQGQSRGRPSRQIRGRKVYRHQDEPPPLSCNNHWKYGRNTYMCLQQLTCPWKDQIVVPSPKNNQ